MTKDEAIKKLIQEVKLIANCGSVEDFTVAGIRCTLRDALYRYNQMSDQPTLTDQSEESGVERARKFRKATFDERWKRAGDHSLSNEDRECALMADYARAQRREVVEALLLTLQRIIECRNERDKVLILAESAIQRFK